jgi:putative transcriptional regulator
MDRLVGAPADRHDIGLMLDMKNRIRVLRADRNWTQADLAEQIGVSRNAVNSIENGRFDPSLPMAYRFSDVFGLPVEDIFPKERGKGKVK